MIAAIVVLYHPNQQATERLLSSLADQVDAVFAVDNTPRSSSSKSVFLEGFGKTVSYIPLGENKGIAAAQNIGIRLSIKGGFSHVLLLDQDSALAPGLVQKMLCAEQALLEKGERIAAICPQISDKRTGKRPAAVHYCGVFVRKVWNQGTSTEPIATDNLIASGSLLRTECLKSVGLMREDLFIEYVDTEWALRAGSMGYKSYCVPNAIMLHCLGDEAMQMFGKDIYLYSALRYQYKLRNAAYLLRLRTMGWNWRIYTAVRIPYQLVLFTLVSKRRCRVFFSLLRGIMAGLRGQLGEIIAE